MSKTGTKSKKSNESAALSANGPQPVWMTLNEARERAFTGEIIFEVDPEVLAYLDNGVVYYAERAADASLGRRLLDAGVIDASQLERGTVRVGDVEHLGRLFDRDPSVDRDSVLVVAETATEDLITELANEAITTIRVTAYRHHPSGVHRWFVAPAESVANQRPISEVAQLDTTVVDDLPGLPIASADISAEELTIEWEESLDGFEELEPLPTIDALDASMLEAMLDGSGDLDVEIILDAPEDEIGDWDQSVEALLDFTTEPDTDDVVQIDPEDLADVVELPLETADEEVDVARNGDASTVVEDLEEVLELEDVVEVEEELWIEVHDDLALPEGDLWTEETDETLVNVEAAEEVGPEAHDVSEMVIEEQVAEDLIIEEMAITDDAVIEEEVVEEMAVDDVVIADAGPDWNLDSADYTVDLEYQVVWPDDDGIVDEDPDALEEAGPVVEAAEGGLYFEMPPLDLTDEPASNEEVPDDVADAVRRAIAAIESAAVDAPSIAPISDPGPGDIDAPDAPATSGLGAFAPPSVDTSAEALYSQWEAAASEAATASEGDAVSMEFDGDESTEGAEDEASERSSALRRLIGSLRRKGH
jgi:hypothetical protein